MAQDLQKTTELVQSLEAAQQSSKKTGKKGDYQCRKSSYAVAGSSIVVDSWKFMDWDYKRSDLPTYARGLFTTSNSNGDAEIVIRGYNKFFNVGEVPETDWGNIEQNTVGPYELSNKENGCILFFSGLPDGTLLVCSKHSTGPGNDPRKSHAVAGERWIEKHLASVGKTTKELARTLREMNMTAVGELCDDSFEEHVLAYPPDQAGIYLHGMNFNEPRFKTLSGPEVHEFADKWGFKKAEYQIIRTISQVKSFLAQCAETGSWNGRDTEGFVVRCQWKKVTEKNDPNWFFKYKFEEPYLMYRQWRECTKALIASKPPKYKKHRKITEEYLNYARRQFVVNPALTKAYQENHGIIAMRDGFLAEKGKRGADIIAEENAEVGNSDAGHKVVLVPVATIGCGKTTVAMALVKLFGWGHVQNDNIQGKGGRPARFVNAVTSMMVTHDVVIADRNNHQKREREQMLNDLNKVVPDAKVAALNYVHSDLKAVRKATHDRVFARGDNHQTIQAASKDPAEIQGIMDGFLQRFQPLEAQAPPDDAFDLIIDLDPLVPSLENLEAVITSMYNEYPTLFKGEMPTSAEMSNAIDLALGNAIAPDQVHDLSNRIKVDKTKQNQRNKEQQSSLSVREMSAEDVIKRLEYFGIGLSTTNINSILSSLFQKSSTAESQFYKKLKSSGRLQDEFHVTLIHRANSSQDPQNWQQYVTRLEKVVGEDTKKGEKLPSLGAARLRLERVIWDDRVMGILVRILPGSDGSVWPCANRLPHITVGTASRDIKPVETNTLLERWLSGDQTVQSKEFSGIQELEGAVKATLQRGTW